MAGSGGTGTGYQWSATGLPTGLSINASTGVISGKTLVTGTVTVTVYLRDSANTQVSKNLSLAIAALPENETSYPYPSGTLVDTLFVVQDTNGGDTLSGYVSSEILSKGLYGVHIYYPSIAAVFNPSWFVKRNNLTTGRVIVSIFDNDLRFSIFNVLSLETNIYETATSIIRVDIYKIKE
jgi:hypothetical protein